MLLSSGMLRNSDFSHWIWWMTSTTSGADCGFPMAAVRWLFGVNPMQSGVRDTDDLSRSVVKHGSGFTRSYAAAKTSRLFW